MAIKQTFIKLYKVIRCKWEAVIRKTHFLLNFVGFWENLHHFSLSFKCHCRTSPQSDGNISLPLIVFQENTSIMASYLQLRSNIQRNKAPTQEVKLPDFFFSSSSSIFCCASWMTKPGMRWKKKKKKKSACTFQQVFFFIFYIRFHFQAVSCPRGGSELKQRHVRRFLNKA